MLTLFYYLDEMVFAGQTKVLMPEDDAPEFRVVAKLRQELGGSIG